ncbi:MAG TPA: hypothetical protein VKO61_01925 [Candidatus Paceibacterota bacterium]|nr:hypothetical protein [Candidatus Paceibacterota bacterium]
MAAPKGNKFSPGRPKGSANKTTTEIRQAYQTFIENNLDEFENWLAQIEDPGRKFDIVIKMSEYFMPKLARQELTGSDGEDLFKNITVKFNTADAEEPKQKGTQE